MCLSEVNISINKINIIYIFFIFFLSLCLFSLCWLGLLLLLLCDSWLDGKWNYKFVTVFFSYFKGTKEEERVRVRVVAERIMSFLLDGTFFIRHILLCGFIRDGKLCDADMQVRAKSKIKNNIIYSLLLLWVYIHIPSGISKYKFCESYVVKANILNQRTYFPVDLNNFSNYLHFYMSMFCGICYVLL